MASGTPVPHLVYQIDEGRKRLLYIAQERTQESMRGFFRMLGQEASSRLRFICSDMWQPYLEVIAQQASQAIHVLDRFHIMKKMNEAIDDVPRPKRNGWCATVTSPF